MLQDFALRAKDIYEQMEYKAAVDLKPPGTLKEYSLFLAGFQATSQEEELEVPGMEHYFAVSHGDWSISYSAILVIRSPLALSRVVVLILRWFLT